MILIVSHDKDLQGDLVCQRLDESAGDYVRIDASRLVNEYIYSINPLQSQFARGGIFSSFRLGFDRDVTEGDVFRAIYWRRPLLLVDRVKITSPIAREVSFAETYHALRLAVDSLPNSYFPLGHPSAMERAGNKLLQLRLANEMGFRVPETLVGNDPQVIRGFLARHPNLVVKPIHVHSSYKEEDRNQIDQPLWCRGIDPEKIAEHLAPDRRVQLMLQEQVVKKEDWRITVLPNSCICCKIDTSELSELEPDWRRYHKKYKHTLFDPPRKFEKLLRDYLKALDLKAGYFDFAVDEAGEPYFLEVNTNAEWLWIEELTGYPISEKVAKCLMGDRG